MQTSEIAGDQQNKKIKRENLGDHLLDYQLNMIGKTKEDVLNDDKWYFNNTLTFKQKEEFKLYSLKLIKKVFKCNKTRSESIFEWFYITFGLRIKN